MQDFSNKRALVFVLMAMVAVVGCGDKTSIATGEVGRMLGSNGLEDKIIEPGVFRMDICGTGACPKVVRCQVNKSATDFKIDKLFLPKSNVDLANVEIGIQFRVKQDRRSIDAVYSEVKPVQAATVEGNQGESNRVLIITTDMIYQTYLKRKAPDAIITALREYTVDQVLSNVPEIATYAMGKINEMLSDTPVEVTELGFPNGIGEPPEEVLVAKRRLFAIEEEKARQVKYLQAELEVEDQRQAVQRKRVANDRANAKAAGVDYATYVFLKNMERFADEGIPLGHIPFGTRGIQ